MKFHNLRQMAASLALQADVADVEGVEDARPPRYHDNLRIYSHLTPQGREDVAERMEQVLRPAKTGVKHVESASNGPLLNLKKMPGGE
jgi:hypothetical protein